MSSHHLESMENLTTSPPRDSKEKPIMTKAVRTTQPKLVYLATEVRASEASKGGLKYELVLAEPAVVTPPRQLVSPQKTVNVSLDEINKKMREAEERRLSMEAKKLSKISTQFERLQEASQKRESFEKEFKEAAMESLQSKMESNKENRDKHLQLIKEKMRDHERHVEEVRQKVVQGAVGESEQQQQSSSG